MNRKLPILIAAAISLSILATNISVDSAIAKRTHESEYGGMGYGESTIIAIRTFPAFLRRILYVVAWPITFPPIARKPSLPAEKSSG